MRQIERSALVAYSASQMYALVNDIEAYPEFLPECKGAEILEKNERQVTARLDLAKGGVGYSFTTCNTFESPASMTMDLVDGPFQSLRGVWTFKRLDAGACKISLHLEFEVKGKLLGKALGTLFNQVANNMVDAFSKRAEYLSRSKE